MVAAWASMVAACAPMVAAWASMVAALAGMLYDGKVAAPAQFSMQTAVKYLSRRGRITCGANHAVRGATGFRHVLYSPLHS